MIMYLIIRFKFHAIQNSFIIFICIIIYYLLLQINWEIFKYLLFNIIQGLYVPTLWSVI